MPLKPLGEGTGFIKGHGKMAFTLATWNINSVRLREELVLKLLREEAPDVLCLQECKSPVEKIPTKTKRKG
jgi:exonuclease III